MLAFAVLIVPVWFGLAVIAAVILGRTIAIRDRHEAPSLADEVEAYLREVAA